MNDKRISFLAFRLSLFIFVMGIVSCTTQKNTWITRTFHNTTARDNGYFWGKLAYDEGIDNLNKTHKDDYSEIIPVYVYPDEKEGPTLYPNMNRAIKKADTMIQKHTITDKSKHEIPDAVKRIKYCYLLLSQAHLYKNDLIQADDALEYATKEYKKSDFRYELLVWQARVFNQLGSVSQAEEIIDLLRSSLKKMPKSTIPDVYGVTADWYMRMGKYDEVANALHKAIKVEKDKKVKARYYFILGQIAERNGDFRDAFSCYSTCLGLHPYDEVDFAARMKRAILLMGGQKENEKIKSNLLKMLKPTRYLDYRDQIYYALAEIALKEGDQPLGLVDLHKSIKASTTNTVQKAVSYLGIGNIDFDNENYVGAKKYYDSALNTLPKKFRGRDTIMAKKQSLDRLVRYLDIISKQDSLQRLGKMGSKRAEKYVDSLLAAQKQQAEEAKQQALANQNGNNPVVPAINNGKWYFYNPTSVNQGINEFVQKYGNRPLEDDWRRSHKTPNANQLNNETASKSDSSKNPVAAAKNDSAVAKAARQTYLKNIPFSDAQVKASNDSLVEAYYNVGYIYQEYIHNRRLAIADFEEFLQRFPDNKYKLIVYYQLYVMYHEMGNDKANYYKDLLLNKYPDSEYALMIRDPEKYKRQQAASREVLMGIYATTLSNYERGNYAVVLSTCQQVDSLYPKNPEMPKFAFMEAGAIGHAQGIEAYKKALQRVIILYPRDTIKVVAQKLLDYLNNKSKVKAPDANVKDTTPVVYIHDVDTIYYWVLLVNNNQSAKINAVKSSLNDMNKKNYTNDNLQIEDIFLNDNQQMLILKKFTTPAKAKDYYNFIINSPDLLKAIPSDSYQAFYISNKNFQLLFKHKKGDEYVQFFKDNLI